MNVTGRFTPQRLAAALALPILGSVALSPLATGAGAGADTFDGRFSGTAAANGLRVTVDVVNSASRNPVDGGGPTTQTSLDSAQSSVAYASHPFPGETALSGPGAFNGVVSQFFPQLGEPPSAPPYPFYVEARHPFTPRSEANGPGQNLEATSSERSAAADATAGFGTPAGSGGFSRSASSVIAGAEGVVATAESRTAGFSAGPLTIGEVVSTASMTLNPDGTVIRDGDITVAGMTVTGVPVSLTDEGLVAGESGAALPGGDPLNQALAAAGIQVMFAPREETPTGVVAPGVKVVQSLPNQTGTATYLIGSASVSLTGSVAEGSGVGACLGACPDGDAAPTSGPVTEATPGAPAQVEATTTPPRLPTHVAPAPLPRAYPLADVPAAPADAGLAAAGPPATPAPAVLPASRPVSSTGTPAAALFDTAGLYPLLLILAAAGLVVAWPTRPRTVAP